MKKAELSLKLALEGIEKHLQDKCPYMVDVLGKKVVICENVWSPKHSKSTAFFAKNIGVKRGQTVIDMGCGCGILAVIASKKGARKVIAADISEDAVQCAKLNIKKLGLQSKIRVYQSDLFNSIPKIKADLIIFNPPFTNAYKKRETPLDFAVFDLNHSTVDTFLKQAKPFLKPRGIVRIVFSVSVGNQKLLKKIFRKNFYSANIIASRKLPYKYHQVYELKPLNEAGAG